jgi:uroporphyrinogen-III synthase
MRKILVLRSGGTDLPEEASGPDVALLTTHEIVPVPVGIAETLAFEAGDARLIISSRVTVQILLGGTKEREQTVHRRSTSGEAGAPLTSTDFFEREFREVVAVGEETAQAVRRAQLLSGDSTSDRTVAPPPVVVPPLPGAAGVLHLLRKSPGGLPGSRILWPRGSDAGFGPIEELRALGAQVTAPVVYEKKARLLSSFSSSERTLTSGFLSGAFGAVAVGSVAALDVFLAALGNPAPGSLPPVRWGVLGSETARVFAARGLPPPAVPARARFANLIELLRKEMESLNP